MKQQKQNTVCTLATVTSSLAFIVLGTSAMAWDAPTNVSKDDDDICWQSSAPSTNIYEDGMYRATVHNQNCFGPVFENSVYQLVAHDHGLDNDFSGFSDPYLLLNDDGMDEPDEGELEFEESFLYAELNNTDGDLGIHSKVDGDEWTEIRLEDPTGRTLIELKNSGSVAFIGLTELFFESAEPTFDELSPSEFFARFPEGMYEWSGITTDGEEIEGEAYFSHKIPAAPTVFVNGNSVEGCDAYPFINSNNDGSFTVSWNEVVTRHPTLGADPGAMDVEADLYQVVLEREEQTVAGQEVTELKLTLDLDADTTEFTIPAGLVRAGYTVKSEMLVKSEEGNQSATEFCWTGN